MGGASGAIAPWVLEILAIFMPLAPWNLKSKAAPELYLFFFVTLLRGDTVYVSMVLMRKGR